MEEKTHLFLEKIDGSFSKVIAAFEIQDMCIFPASVFSAGIKYVVDPVKYWKYISQWTKPEPVIKFSRFTIKLFLYPLSSAGE